MIRITGGKYRNKRIPFSENQAVRPTKSIVREAVFNMLGARVNPGDCLFIDSFAGSGVMGMEALSRGFARVAFIEKSRSSFQTLKQNLGGFSGDSDKMELIHGDFFQVFDSFSGKKFMKVFFFDPPYDDSDSYKKISNLNRNEGKSFAVAEFHKTMNFKPDSIEKVRNFGISSICLFHI